jgi:hypothetical protein
MAVKEHPSSLREATVLQIGDFITKLERRSGVAREELRLRARSARFDVTFFVDLIIAVAVFAVTLICYLYQVPIFDDPLALLVGPLIGLVLALKHRAPR